MQFDLYISADDSGSVYMMGSDVLALHMSGALAVLEADDPLAVGHVTDDHGHA